MPLCQVPLDRQDGGFGFVIMSLTTQDIRGLKKELPPYLDDPIGVGEKVEQCLGNADYTWKDWDFLLGILFGPEEKWMILQKAHQLWEDEHPQAAGNTGQNASMGDDTIPQVGPNWYPNNQASLAHLWDYGAYLIRAIKTAVPRTNSASKAMSLKQEKDERPSHWLERTRNASRKQGGLDPEGLAFGILLRVQFVTKSWHDIRRKIQKDEEWKNRPLEELVTKAQQVYGRRDEEKAKAKARVMAQVLQPPKGKMQGPP